MVDLNGAGETTFGGLSASADGQTQWWNVIQDDPYDLEWIPSTTYAMKFHVDTWNNGVVDVRMQISTSPSFGSFFYNAVTPSVPESPETSVIVSSLVDGTTYYWRVRAEHSSGSLGPWSPVQSFKVFLNSSHAVEYIYENAGVSVTTDPDAAEYVYENVGVILASESFGLEYIYENIGVLDTTDSDAVEYAYLGDVDTNTPHPRIWFLLPNYGREGDGIAIYGFGFGDLQGTFSGVVEIDWGGVTGWQSVPIVSWQTFPPKADAYTADRELNEITGDIDMQHTVIEIIVPSGAIPPGYPVRVRTDGP